MRGERGWPEVALCDGIGCMGYVWKYLEQALEEHKWRQVHWHYRGHGRTPMPLDPRRVAIADLADDLAAVLDATNVEKAVLAGHSMGVQVVLETYRRHRDRVAGMMLMCGSYGNPLRTFHGRRTLETILPWVRLMGATTPRVVRAIWRNMIPTELSYIVAKTVEVNPELIRREDFFPYLEGIAKVDPLLFGEMLAHAGRHSARELLSEIDVPVLVIAGDRDGFTPMALSKTMGEKIPRAELLVVEGGSHTTPIEKPELVNGTVLDFLERRIRTAKPKKRERSKS